VTMDRAVRELEELARFDAGETFMEEQLEGWWQNVRADAVPEPRREWLRGQLGREPNKKEWEVYATAYKRALARGVKYVESRGMELESSAAAAQPDDDAAWDALYAEVTDEAFHRVLDEGIT